MKYLWTILLFTPALLLGQEAQPELATVSPEVLALAEKIQPYIGFAVERFPFLTTVFAVMGAVRAIFKPAMSLIWSVINLTPNSADNEKYKAVTSNKIFGIVAYLVDYFGSMKIKNPKA